MSPLTHWLVHPWLLGAGLAAISLPILIHLLSRRRYRVVDWAAMEFLLAAERRNRRRIRIEDWSLLVLRCLAIICLGLLLARPFMSFNTTAGLGAGARTEHIVVLDDSLSMQAHLGTEAAFDRARRRLLEWCRQLASEQADHSFTVLRTSQPQKPVLAGANLGASAANDILRTLEELQPSQERTELARTLEELNAKLDPTPQSASRVIYVFSDLRASDWDEPTTTQLRKLADKVQGLYIVDCAEDKSPNLSIVELRPDGTPTAGLPVALDVLVKNQGRLPVSDVRVALTAGQSLPMHMTIERIAPQETGAARFPVPLQEKASESGNQPHLLKLKAEVTTAAGPSDDRLMPDSVAWYTALLSPGIRVLLVDGAPNPDDAHSQSFYLRRALAPSGPLASGILVEVVHEEQLESATLDDYEVVFLQNSIGFNQRMVETIARLDGWVRAGGALAIMPGDQIDPGMFNAHFWQDGLGLSPLRLNRVQGDDRRERWVQLQIEEANHELTRHFAGPSNPLLTSLKIFRWWDATQGDAEKEANVLARLTNSERSPAIVQRVRGQGQVVAFCFPADAEWTNWPSQPSYVLFMQDLVRWLSSSRGDSATWMVGQSIQTTIDIARYETGALWTDPAGQTTTLQASPPSAAPQAVPLTAAQPSASTQWEVRSPPTAIQGVHQLQLKKRGRGSEEIRAFAVNIDPTEGNLRRIDPRLRQTITSSKIKFLDDGTDLSTDIAGSKSELWHFLLAAAVVLLFAEQALGWYLGRVRS